MNNQEHLKSPAVPLASNTQFLLQGEPPFPYYQLLTTTQEPTTVEETTQAVLTMYTTDTLNLRQSASTEAEIITQVPSGKAVTVLNNEGEWYQVQYGDKQGYLKAEYLKADESQTTQQAGESGTVAETTSAVETTSTP